MKRKKQPEKDFWDEFFAPLRQDEAFGKLGLTSGASRKDVIRAFREKVKAMADGKGGYIGDMDALVQAKEQALKCLE
jgi:hypothetical protein